MSIIKVFFMLIVGFVIVGSVYWFGWKPETIRMGCNEQALSQSGLPLTYFRRNTDGVNDAFVKKYEECLKANQFYSYTPDLIWQYVTVLIERF